MDKLSQDSSSSVKGTIYQFYHSIERCFDLVESQHLYIEKYGDISIDGQDNIEVKAYQENLTDAHDNFWKTLSNWVQDGFPHSKYHRLILLTTQQIGPNSRFQNWNENQASTKLVILREIYDVAREKYNKTKKEAMPSSLRKMEKVLNVEEGLLLNILSKFDIYDASPVMGDEYEILLQKHAKGVLEKNKRYFINALIGFVLSPEIIEDNGWEISYERFTKEVAQLTGVYSANTQEFPTKQIDNSKITPPLTHGALYIQKIMNIDYAEVISDAHLDYMFASEIIIDSFQQGTSAKRLRDFGNQILYDFNISYRKSCRKCSASTIDDSKDFYDECMITSAPVFPGYQNTPKQFRNGMLHIEMDDLDKGLKWRLEKG